MTGLTPRRALALLQRGLAGVVLVVSGTYLVVYLYRWEWNRAIIAGLFFVAAEVVLATTMVLRRLRAIEARTAPPGSVPAVRARLEQTPVDRPQPFRWLSPRSGTANLGVFVPVLLGTGVVLSAVAYAVERIAEATALPAADRRLAGRMAAVAPPPGGLTGRTTTAPVAGPPRRRPFGGTVAALVAVAGIVGVAALGIGALLEAAQSRPDTAARPASTTIGLEIVERRNAGSPEVIAEALWVGCRWTVSRNTTIESRVVPTGGNRVDLVLRPGVGELATRRLAGCLHDLRIDFVRAEVLAVENGA